MILPILAEIAHVAAAIVWAGGHALLVLAVLPTSLDQSMLLALAPRMGRTQRVAGTATLVFGVARVLAGQMLPSLRAVLTTPYGWSVLASIAITLALTIHGARMGRAIEAGIPIEPRSGQLALVGYAAVVVLMVLMRFGL